MLRVKLRRLDRWNTARRAHANLYTELLAGLDISLPSIRADAEHVWHLYVVAVEDRSRIQHELNERGIATGIHYPTPIHLQPAYRHLGHRDGDFPMVERLAQRVLSLPMFPELRDEQIEYVSEVLAASLRGRSIPGPRDGTLSRLPRVPLLSVAKTREVGVDHHSYEETPEGNPRAAIRAGVRLWLHPQVSDSTSAGRREPLESTITCLNPSPGLHAENHNFYGFPNRVRDTCRDDVVLRFVLLQHQPHRSHVVTRVTPVAVDIEIAQNEARRTNQA